MASTIKLKNSTTAGNSPSSLETGEVAINVADGNLFYGSASAVLQNFVVDELEVKGNLTAQQYIVSSSVIYTTQSFSSGSTAFGDSADDSHEFTGNITASGNISASGDLIIGGGLEFGGDSSINTINSGDDLSINPERDLLLGSTATDVIKIGRQSGTGGAGRTEIYANTSTVAAKFQEGTIEFNHPITSSGDISASGTIIGDTLTVNAITFPQDTNITIQTPDEDESFGTGGNLTLEAGNGAGSMGKGGDLIFNAGKASGGGERGDIIFNTFGATAGSSPKSGSIVFNGRLDASQHAVTSSNINVGTGGQFSVDLSNPVQSRLKITSNGHDLGIFDTHTNNAGKLTIGNIVVSDGMDISGNITGHITASGNISASGNIYATEFHGDGSNLTNLPSQTDENFTTADHTKLDGIEASADVTDATNVQAAGALMDSELSDLAAVKAINQGLTTTSNVVFNKIGLGSGGTASSPIIYRTTDTDTGIYFPSTNNIAIQAGGGNAELTINTTGVTVGGTTADLYVGNDIIHTGDTDTQIRFTTNNISLEAGGTQGLELDSNGSTLPNVKHNVYDTSSAELGAAGGAIGDIVKFGGTSTTAGKVYYLKPDGTWDEAQANAGGTASSSLAVALGSNSTTDGMCLRGIIYPSTDPGATIGHPVFLSDTNSGRMLATAPDTSGDFVRIVGHQFGTNLIYFNPSPDFIELS